ncbi:MAG: putative nicotinate-nucleotide pyrophosphorylase [carboxylating] [Candidatus Heimdallarchaeota archaeon AB_125]|nr:MAG: putative nicotinate-nucleotide pyrophosphorylase [carboxylating] [Candidatus Heimdallarchaeota archaeon AB_125]
MIPPVLVDEDIKRWIEEDIPYWDVTTSLLPSKKTEGKIYTKQEGVVAGLIFVKRIFEFLGAECEILTKEGEKVSKATTVAIVKGDIHSLLQAERVSLNILGRLSGIATKTAIMVEIANRENPELKICATRKIVPGLSKYDKYAVVTGGGDTHRFNLSDMILLKENHLRGFDSLTLAIRTAKSKTSFSKKVEVEIQTKEQAIEATKAGADIIMLDNFSPQEAKETIELIKKINDDAYKKKEKLVKALTRLV